MAYQFNGILLSNKNEYINDGKQYNGWIIKSVCWEKKNLVTKEYRGSIAITEEWGIRKWGHEWGNRNGWNILS